MGASKRVAEEVVLAHAPAGAAYSVVRFGNVLGSRGSVIPTFARQIAAGGPITVTDPRMTRFFMSVEEAVQLVLQASVLSQGGEIFMLEMGEPVRILDLAQRMIRLSGHEEGTEIPVRMIGRRPGREAPRGAAQPRRRGLPHLAPLHPPPGPGERLRGASPPQGLQALRDAMFRRDAPAVRDLLFSLADAGQARLVGQRPTMSVDADPDPVSA